MKKNIFIILGLVVLVLIVQRVPIELGRGLASTSDVCLDSYNTMLESGADLTQTRYNQTNYCQGVCSTKSYCLTACQTYNQCLNNAVTGYRGGSLSSSTMIGLGGNGLTAPTSSPVDLCAGGAQPNSCGVKKNPNDTGYNEYLTCIHQHLCWSAGVTGFRGDYKGYTTTKNGGCFREPYVSDPTSPTMDQDRKC